MTLGLAQVLSSTTCPYKPKESEIEDTQTQWESHGMMEAENAVVHPEAEGSRSYGRPWELEREAEPPLEGTEPADMLTGFLVSELGEATFLLFMGICVVVTENSYSGT